MYIGPNIENNRADYYKPMFASLLVDEKQYKFTIVKLSLASLLKQFTFMFAKDRC